MKKFRSISYVKKGAVDFIEVESPDPAANEVQIEALACGVCAWDIHLYKNGPDGPAPAGHEGIGRIVKVGRDVKHLKEGDHVVGGSLGFAERVTVAPHRLYVVPHTRRPEHWIVEPVACVVTGLDHCKLKAADRIAIVGCGFMGLMFVQALSKSLVDQLIVIDIDPKRLAMAKKFGATEIFDAREVEWQKLKSRNIDTVVDCSGSQQGLDLSSKIVKNGGRLNLFGWNHGTGQFPGDLWHMNGITVINSAPGSAERDTWPVAIRLLDRGQIELEPLVSHVVPLDEYPALLEQAAKRDGSYLKGVVRLSS